MKIITINRKKISVTASDERAIRIVAKTGYAKRSEFEEGRTRRYCRSILPSPIWRGETYLGMRPVYKQNAKTNVNWGVFQSLLRNNDDDFLLMISF